MCMHELDKKRKEKSQVVYKRKKQLDKLCAKTEKSAEEKLRLTYLFFSDLDKTRHERIGVAFYAIWYVSGIDKTKDIEATQRAQDFQLGCGGRYIEKDAKSIVIQIPSVASFTHLQGVVHRDLKLEMATKGYLGEVVTTCERSWAQASSWGFPSGAKRE
uniref:CDPK-related kinase 4-like n=1 Tax=Tanacetum cinerariifolium TaxID=118510 RepID=A0A6L2KZD0_TANCI|nr:CDPK-related kinase 4-like [Tanacetum cinerariifolium]